MIYLLFLLQASVAQQPATAVVQFEKGNIQVVEPAKNVKFPDLIYLNQTVRVAEDSLLKLKHRNGCISVHYPKASVTLSEPPSATGASRWICKNPGQIKISGQNLTIEESEILIVDNIVHIIEGQIKDAGDLETVRPSDPEIIELNQRFPPPEESYQPTPERIYTSRYFLMLSPPFNIGAFDHGEDHYDTGNLQTGGVRIGTHQKIFGTDAMLFFGFHDSSNPKNDNHQMGPPPVGYNGTDFESFVVGIGKRHSNFQDNSSLYYYAGYLQGSSHISRKTDNFDFFGRLHFYSVMAGAGYDMIFWPKSKFALYTSIEFMVSQSIGNGWIDKHNNWFMAPPHPEPKRPVRTYSLFINFGPIIQF